MHGMSHGLAILVSNQVNVVVTLVSLICPVTGIRSIYFTLYVYHIPDFKKMIAKKSYSREHRENREGLVCLLLLMASTTITVRETPGLSIQKISNLTAVSRAAHSSLKRSWNLHQNNMPSTNLPHVCSETINYREKGWERP